MDNKLFHLTVTSDRTEIVVDSVDADEVARIVQLAGLPPQNPTTAAPAMMPPAEPMMPPAEPMADMQTCSICGASDHSEVECPDAVGMAPMLPRLGEAQAEHDYGHDDVDDEGDELDPKTYVWQSPRIPQRPVKGNMGDNSLISELHAKMLKQYELYLNEGESWDNEDGILSPLSDPTKPEFDKDPFANEDPVDDGSHSPMSTIKRQPLDK